MPFRNHQRIKAIKGWSLTNWNTNKNLTILMCISFYVDINHEDISPLRDMHTQNRYYGEEHNNQEEVINIPIRSLLKA